MQTSDQQITVQRVHLGSRSLSQSRALVLIIITNDDGIILGWWDLLLAEECIVWLSATSFSKKRAFEANANPNSAQLEVSLARLVVYIDIE